MSGICMCLCIWGSLDLSVEVRREGASTIKAVIKAFPESLGQLGGGLHPGRSFEERIHYTQDQTQILGI